MSMDKKVDNFLSEWLIFAFFAMLLVFLLGYVTYHEHADITRREKQRLSEVASVAEYMLAKQLEKIDTTLSKIRDVMTFPGGESPDEKPSSLTTVGSRLKIVAGAMSSVSAITIVDARGDVVASNLDELVGKNTNQSDYYQTPYKDLDPEVFYISPPFTNALGDWTINLSRVILSTGGSYAGVVTATLDLDYFSALMNAVRYSENAWVRVVHGRGIVFIWEPKRPGMVGKDRSAQFV